MTLGRHHWMDALRGASVLLVVLWHAFSLPYDTIPAGVDWVMNFLSVYRVPLLLLLSGLLLSQSVRKRPGVYISGKLRRIAWPLLVWSGVLALVGWPDANPANPWFWLGDAAHLWYLGVLLACYAVGMLTKWINPLFILVVGFICMELIRSDIAYVNNALWFGLFFFAGATLTQFLDRWLRMRWIVPTLCLFASIAWAGYSSTFNGYAPIAHWRPLVLSILGIIAVVWFASRAPRVRWLEWVGKRSIVFYVAHVPIIWLLMPAVIPLGLPVLTYIVVILGAGLGCFVLGKYLNGSLLFEFPRRKVATPTSEPLA